MQIHVKVAMNKLIVFPFFLLTIFMFLFQKFRHCELKVELFVQYNEYNKLNESARNKANIVVCSMYEVDSRGNISEEIFSNERN